ncbi:unnamed protein product [Acanthocheilonema viteae]|uniref:Uncharacterized protein n=1 Tax=Acanthocheilonema viteae TaxID=6277 RepID=A0A498SAG2_ACAVI|nr:unnamed protein product [Acanthocheilonema viteae]
MMDRWSTGTACAISISFSLTVIALAVLDTVTGHSQQIFLKKGKEATVNQSTFCSRQCSKISSFELRNLQILSPEERQIQMLHNDIPLDTNLRINYYDVEMEGMKPAFCGDYFALEMPIYSIKESKSNDIQFLHKLYFQNYRDVYTHSMCNQECVFGCRQFCSLDVLYLYNTIQLRFLAEEYSQKCLRNDLFLLAEIYHEISRTFLGLHRCCDRCIHHPPDPHYMFHEE